MVWRGVPNTNIEVSEDGERFRWTFDRDGAEFLATDLYPDGTSKDLFKALDFADELRRIHRDTERFGVSIVLVPKEQVQ